MSEKKMPHCHEIECFIKEIADSNFQRFWEQGKANAGNNGPYFCKDTPVRNTGHWLIIYSYLWKRYKLKKYMDISFKFAEYLICEQQKTKSGAIECMEGERFDHLNGLIGQAWTIEALTYAAKVFKQDKYYETALSIYKSQIFDDDTRLWKRVEIDATVLDYDYATNHQVWFAIAGCMLNDYKYDQNIDKQINLFLEGVYDTHFQIYRNGLIKHFLNLKRPGTRYSFMHLAKKTVKNLLKPCHRIDPNKYDPYAMEKGYHIFELYGYAVIYHFKSRCKLFEDKSFEKALKYGLNIKKLNKFYNIRQMHSGRVKDTVLNKYSYGYNSPAFEMPYILCTFTNELRDEDILRLFKYQLDVTYNEGDNTLNRHNFDSETLTARIYEYIRFFDFVLGE